MKIQVQLQDTPKPEPGTKGHPVAKRPPKWWQSMQRVYQVTAKAINGNIEFGNPTSGPVNINGVWASTTTPGAANTDFTITHNLSRTAVGYILMTANAAVDIYTSPTANPNPNTQIILRASVATVAITLFIV